MSSLDQTRLSYLSMFNERHPRMTRILAFCLFLAGLLLCARIV